MCRHAYSSIVTFEFIDDVLGALFFSCCQCDDCGIITQEPVTDDDVLALPTDPPTLDKKAYWEAVKLAAYRCISEG